MMQSSICRDLLKDVLHNCRNNGNEGHKVPFFLKFNLELLRRLYGAPGYCYEGLYTYDYFGYVSNLLERREG
jgi:hypothetical protein